MAYVALYRKWRPGDFDNLVGQDHISKTLANAIKTGKIAHAYLFSGPRGTGKTSTAKILAKALNCEHGPTPSPCNQCASCTKIDVGSSMDVFEIDAASNRGIDEIRDLRETVKFTPVDGKYKVYIIDEVHMLTMEAFNALLKTLEEPPSHVVFILATTEAHKVPATIHSRCQRYDFKRISISEIKNRLGFVAREMKLAVDEDALKLIASHADGGLRDALSILDQCSTLDDADITVEKVRNLLGLVGHEWIWRIVDFLAEKKTKDLLQVIDKLIKKGKDVKQILIEIALHMRSVMIYQVSSDAVDIELYSEEESVLKQHSAAFTKEEIVQIIQKMHAALNETKWSPQPRITTEVALLSLCEPVISGMGADSQLLERIAILEEKIGRLSVGEAEQLVKADRGTHFAAPQIIRETARSRDAASQLSPNTQVTTGNQPDPVDLEDISDATDVWNKMLKILIENGKRSIYACVSQGRLRGMNGNQMIIAFRAAFPKERTEKNDYREILEAILHDICQRNIVLQCNLENVAPVSTPKPKPKKKTEPIIDENLSPAEKQVIDAAVQVFGNNFVPKEETKK